MFELSEEVRIITVYNYLSATKEFIGQSDAYIAPMTGLPANCTNIAPPKNKKGYVCAFDSDAGRWVYLEDHRGHTAFYTDTGNAFTIQDLGALPDNLTLLAPSPFCVWDGSQWKKDEDAEKTHLIAEAENQKQQLLSRAVGQISVLQDAVDLEMATKAEAAALLAWKKYRIALNRIDPAQAPDIEWPEIPA